MSRNTTSGSNDSTTFALAFWIQGLQWLHSGTRDDLTEYSPVYYVARLVAYGLIVAAIVRKNLRRGGQDGAAG